MAIFSDILKRIKKPVDALKDFLTPKEKRTLESDEKPSPLQRLDTSYKTLPAFDYKPPSLEGVKSFVSSFVPPKEAFGRKELAPRETPEERAERLAKARETARKIAEFGKAVLRATPRAAASLTLEAQGRRKMIPETRAEKFLFGEEPLESITERIERFPERAAEFGIQEPAAKKIAPFAVLGLTALDILPPLPGKSALKGAAKKALTTKTAKEFAKSLTKKESKQILKAGFKSVDDFFEVAKNPAAKASTKIVDELKAVVPAKQAAPGIPKELESLVPKAQPHKDVNFFIREISGDTYAPEFRNPIADFWRKKYIQPLSKGSKAAFTTDVVAFERNLDDVLKTKYSKEQLANMSVRQKSEIVNGRKWANLYGDMLENNLFKSQQDFFKAAKAAAPTSPTAALKEAAGKTIHAKKLETGIDEAYRALEKAGKDEVYNLGKVGDYIADPKVREQYKDVLDTPLYIKRQMHMGKAHGSLSVDPKGNPAIVLSDGLTADMIDRTLVEELTHAKQFRKGVRPTKGVPYKEIPEEARAKKAAKHFAPKTTLEDVIEAGVPAKPSEELKKILYHGTDLENVPKIQKGGFKVGGFLAHGYPQGVYFTTTAKEAKNYGEVIEATTKLKLSDFFDVSKHKELNKLQGPKYVQKLNQIIREAAESRGVEIPKPTKKQLKQYTGMIGKLKDPLDISDIKTATLQKLGYKGFIAAEKGIGKEIVIFNPKDIVVGGRPSEVLKAASKISEPVQKTKVVRFSTPATVNTDKFRGGTWYAAKGSKTYDFSKEFPNVGGTTKTEKTLELRNPLVVEGANMEDGSFVVINEGFENFLPAKQRLLGNELWNRFHLGDEPLTDAQYDKIISNILKRNGNTETEIKAVLSSKNSFDAAMDLVISKGLKKEGYDSLILTNVYKGKEIDRHILKFAEAEKAAPTAELKEALKAKTAAKKLPEIPEIKGVKAVEDLSKPAKAAEPSKVQEIISEYQKRISTKPAKAPGTPLADKFAQAYTAIIDRFNPITKLARKAGDLRPGENPELLARRYLGVQGIAESKLFWNTTRLTAEGNLEVTGKGLSKILRPVKDNIDDLRTLMIAERDIELASRALPGGKKIIGTTPEKSKQVLSALRQKHGTKGFERLANTAKEVREWSHRTLLDPLLEVGAISKEQYETITKSNKFYVPFQRVIEELETHGFVPKKANIFSPKSVPVKKLKGSTKEIIDPFESLITNTYKVTDFVERARVGRSITNLRKLSPELAEMIKPISPKIVPVAKQGEDLIFRPSFFAPDKNTIMVFEEGKRKFYQVPPDVFQAVSGMMESDVGAIMKLLAFPARTLRAGATLTPEFMGRNPFRDQFTAFVFSKYGYIPGVDLAKGIFNTVGKTDLHGRWLAGGGAHSMLVSLDRVTSQATLFKVLGAKDIKGVVKNPIEALRILSEFGEKGTRVGAFGRAIRKGVTDLEAAFESRDITLDFARRGSQTRAVNMLVAFWNAQVQGLNKLVRAFRERPAQTTFKAVSGITLPSVLLYLNNRNDPRYQELPQWQKDLFWILPIGDDGPIIRIPKPFEVGIIFGTVPEHILAWIDKNEPEALSSMAKTLMEASAPGYIPTGLQPIIENITNYSFFRQRPIVSEGKQSLPKELQANRYTSETAKEVGKLINQSPAKIENLAYGYTAGLGRYALDISDKILKALGVAIPPPEPEKTLADRPFIRAFIAREPIGSGSESVNKFYKLYDEANQTKAAVKDLAQEGKEEEAVKYLRSHPAGFHTKGLNKVARTFADLRKKRDAVLDSRDLTPEQKKRAIDALDKIMTEVARQTVELVETSNERFRQ